MMLNDEPNHIECSRIKSVVRWIEKRHGYIASSVIRMGQIHFTPRIDSAGVVVDGPDIHLYFSPKFFNKLTDSELASILIHESFHLVFKHQARSELIKDSSDRNSFDVAAEAVINDIITSHFPDCILPGKPIRGSKLVGRDTSKLSVDQVVELMKTRHGGRRKIVHIALDVSEAADHDTWEQAEFDLGGGTPTQLPGMPHEEWTNQADAPADIFLTENARSVSWGLTALGKRRHTAKTLIRKNLRRFLQDIVRPSYRHMTLWNQIPRKAMAIYPEVILPTYEPENRRLNVLMAVDSSGSIPSSFLAHAVQTARQRIPGTTTTLVAFDTEVYEFWHGAAPVLGGGGTNVQAVEHYARKGFKRYPNVVIVFSDGDMPTPSLTHPDRWVWILPPWGTKRPISPKSRVAYFDDIPLLDK